MITDVEMATSPGVRYRVDRDGERAIITAAPQEYRVLIKKETSMVVHRHTWDCITEVAFNAIDCFDD